MNAKKNVNVIVSFIIVVILAGTVFTAYGEEKTVIIDEQDNSNIMDLSLEDAISQALENSTTLSSIDRNIESLKETLKEQNKLKKNAKKIVELPLKAYDQAISSIKSESGEPDFLTILLLKNGYGVAEVSGQLELLEKKRVEAEESIVTVTKVAYYKTLIASKSVEINRRALENAEKKLEDANRKYEVGTITAIEVLKGELSVNQAIANLSNSVEEYKIQLLTLKNLVGIPFEQDVNLISDVDNNINNEINLEESILAAKKNRIEVLEAKKNIETSQIKYDSYKSYYTSSSKISAAHNEFLDAQYNLQTAYSDIELDVMQNYYKIEKNYKSLEHIDKTISLLEESLRITELFYEHGMATSTDVLQAQSDLNEAIIGKYKSSIAYEISLIMFENCLD